jgi:hypothetical protein
MEIVGFEANVGLHLVPRQGPRRGVRRAVRAAGLRRFGPGPPDVAPRERAVAGGRIRRQGRQAGDAAGRADQRRIRKEGQRSADPIAQTIARGADGFACHCTWQWPGSAVRTWRPDDATQRCRLVQPSISNRWLARLLVAFRTTDVRHARGSHGAQGGRLAPGCAAARRPSEYLAPAKCESTFDPPRSARHAAAAAAYDQRDRRAATQRSRIGW